MLKFLSFVGVSLASVTAFAAPITWDSNGASAGTGGVGTWDLISPVWNDSNLTWDNTLNAADTAIFEGTAGTVTLNNGGAAINALGLNFNVTGYTLASATATDTLNFGSTQGLIDSSTLGTGATTNGNLATISANLAGTAGVSIAANGNTASANGGGSSALLNLTGTNTGLTGGIVITNGLVRFGSQDAAGTNAITLNGGGLVVSSAGLGLSNSIELASGGGTFRIWGTQALTTTGVLSGAGTLTKTDSGTLVLANNANTFSGTVNILGGTLQLGNSTYSAHAFAASSLTLAAGTTLNFYSNSTGTNDVTYNFANMTSATLDGATLNFRQANNTRQNINVGFALSNTNSIIGAFSNASSTRVVRYAGAITGTGTLNVTTTGNSLSNAMVFTNASNAYTGSVVLGSATAASSFNLVNPIGMASVSINDADWTVGLSGTTHTFKSLAGTGGSIQSLSGTTTLRVGSDNTDSTFAGTIAASTGNTNTASGSVTTSITRNGVLSLVKEGTGSLTLSGSNSFTGTTTVLAGTLMITGSLTGSGTISVNGGTLAGTGSITGATTLADASLAPGTSVGTLTLANGLTLGSNTNLLWEMNPLDNSVGGTSNDLLNILDGGLTLDGNLNIIPSNTSFAGLTSGTWRLINYVGTFTDNALEVSSVSQALLDPGYAWAVDTSTPGQVNVSIVAQAIPEPGTFVLAGVATLGFFGLRLRRQR
jgi:fibronectin-binding autotransporter adhesin